MAPRRMPRETIRLQDKGAAGRKGPERVLGRYALYGRLAMIHPSAVVEVNRAVAVAMAESPGVGLTLLHRIKGMDDFYPYHVARADLLRRMNQRDAAADAYQRALELCGNSAEHAYLQRRFDEMNN